MRTMVIRDNKEFAALEGAWNRVLASSRQDNVFLTHQWLFSWWTTFGCKNELYIIVCCDELDDDVSGILPCYIEKKGLFLKKRTLKFLGGENVGSDFLDCIVDRESEKQVHEMIFNYLYSNKNEWDFIELTDFSADSSFVKYLKDAGVGFIKIVELNCGTVCPFIPLPKELNTYMSGLTSNMRRKIRARKRNLMSEYMVELDIETNPELLDEAFVDLVRLHQARRNQKGNRGIFESAKIRDFHREICRKFMEFDWLELAFLKIDGERVASVYQFKYQNTIYYYQTGFKVDWLRWNVGFVLLGMLIEKAINDGMTSYEFLRGEEKYKYDWGATGERNLVNVYCSSGSIFSDLRLKRFFVVRIIKEKIKTILPSQILGFIKYVKYNLNMV